MNGNPLIVPITDFVRRAKHFSDLLPDVGTMVITRDGRPYMDVKLNNQERNRRLLKFAGIWKDTGLDSDELWAKVFARRNRNKPIRL